MLHHSNHSPKPFVRAEDCILEDITSYSYLTNGSIPVSGEGDVELYKQLLAAMDVIGFTKDEQIRKDSLLFLSW